MEQAAIPAVTPVPGVRASWCQPQQPWSCYRTISSAPFILLPHSLTPGADAPGKYLFDWIWEDLASTGHGGGEKRSARLKRKRGSHHLDTAFTAAIGRPTKSDLLLFIFMNLSYHVNHPALRVSISKRFLHEYHKKEYST